MSEPKYKVGDVVYWLHAIGSLSAEIDSGEIESVDGMHVFVNRKGRVSMFLAEWQLFASVDELLANLKSKFEESNP